jgi:hypothetical protein
MGLFRSASSSVFTPAQEARLREIVREEIGRGPLEPGEFHRIAERFLEMMPVRASDVTGVRALMRRLKERRSRDASTAPRPAPIAVTDKAALRALLRRVTGRVSARSKPVSPQREGG